MNVYALVVAAALGGAGTLFAVHIGRKAVRCWRLISALEREHRRNSPGLSIVPAVADGTAPAPYSRRAPRKRLPKRRPGAALLAADRFDVFPPDDPHTATDPGWMDDTTISLSLRAINDATHELAHLHPVRTEIHP